MNKTSCRQKTERAQQALSSEHGSLPRKHGVQTKRFALLLRRKSGEPLDAPRLSNVLQYPRIMDGVAAYPPKPARKVNPLGWKEILWKCLRRRSCCIMPEKRAADTGDINFPHDGKAWSSQREEEESAKRHSSSAWKSQPAALRCQVYTSSTLSAIETRGQGKVEHQKRMDGDLVAVKALASFCPTP